MRILHLASSGGLYGAEQVILNLARTENIISYVGALHNVHNPNLDIIAEAERSGLRTVVFNSGGRIDVRTIPQIERFLKKNDIDILHTHNYKADILGFAATRFGRTKWVATNHVWHPISRKMRLYEGLDAFVLRFARRVVAVSRQIKEDLISTKVRPANIRVVPNGIDIDRFKQPRPTGTLRTLYGILENDVVVTIVGRLSPEKGHRTFLEAAGRMSATIGHVKFLIIGDGPMREELRAEVSRLDLDDRIVFAGFRNDMPELYALSNVLVNASTIEGLPMTILEAMASSVPIIATRAGGIPDIITDHETGLLVDANDVDALEGAIRSLIDNPDQRRRLATSALEFVTANHSYKRMCERYQLVYREVLSGN